MTATGFEMKRRKDTDTKRDMMQSRIFTACSINRCWKFGSLYEPILVRGKACFQQYYVSYCASCAVYLMFATFAE